MFSYLSSLVYQEKLSVLYIYIYITYSYICEFCRCFFLIIIYSRNINKGCIMYLKYFVLEIFIRVLIDMGKKERASSIFYLY